MACTDDPGVNIDKAESLVRSAGSQGANLILLQELLENLYFCSEQNPVHFSLARSFKNNPLIAHFAAIAKELSVVLPMSFFAKTQRLFFNAMAMINADGTVLGLYRKIHIPGDTGFRTWHTAAGHIGVGIRWDQWFPEAARAMSLMGADVLLYPITIGSEPQDANIHSQGHWCRTMQGHVAANMAVVASSNRIGMERMGEEITFYGGKFIADKADDLLSEIGEGQEISLAKFDLEEIANRHAAWGDFRDRRPQEYQPLC